ncbi:MAG: alpha-galactosidase [Actinomycetota bacterium]|jgi:hypothetical protein|nr:alpha-galactosidase [Actinomycetota bacterium]
MRRTALALTAVLLAGSFASAPAVGAAEEPTYSHGSVYVNVTDDSITMGNDAIERTWARSGFGTTDLTNKTSWSSGCSGCSDFTLDFVTESFESRDFDVQSFTVDDIADGLRVNFILAPSGLSTVDALNVRRSIEMYEGISGFRTDTSIIAASSLPLRSYTLERLGRSGAPTIHAFRAGADWREEGWNGAQVAIGDKHAGDWRETKTAPAGADLSAPGEWISVESHFGDRLFMVMERNDFPSSRALYENHQASLVVDHTRDIISAGPFESDVHAENPQGEKAGRVRLLKPLEPFALETAFTGFADSAADEAWQFHKYLVDERLDPYAKDITFNSNGTDGGVISTGAKDDMDYDTVVAVAQRAKDLGIETFILDDGWQANSGDWWPDCPGHVDYRNLYPARFPDCDFTAVREAIAPMKLGLWMNPMHLNPQGSQTFKDHPEWGCEPINAPLTAYNVADPNGGSNEAGLGMWGPDAITGGTLPAAEHSVEWWIRNAIENWEVKYFKYDFLAWADCAGQGDLYEYKEAFTAMLDRLIADYPDVTFSIDETNDYRLFPFESVSRGPSWFQNGSPTASQLLHNIWNLSPYIPSFYIGQHFLGGSQWRNGYSVDTLMAVALTSHMTFFSDLRPYPQWVIDEAAPWTAFYKANREALTQLVYPLLSDPTEDKWTALQSWNPDEGFGALLAFRQNDSDGTKTIALENVPAGMTFDLFEGPGGGLVGTYTSQQLSDGLTITLPQVNTAKVLIIRPHVAGQV